MSYSDNQPPLHQSLVIGESRFDGILKQLRQDDETKAIKEDGKMFQEYLKTESEKMKREWVNSKEAIRIKKAEDKIKRDRELVEEGERRYKELMRQDEQHRRDRVSKAEDLFHRLKPGPRQLESAAILSEVLQGQEIQRKLNKDHTEKMKNEKMNEGREKLEQAYQEVEEQNRKMCEKKKWVYDYKKEVSDYNKNEAKRKRDCIEMEAELERKKREAANMELKNQIERERKMLAKKKEAHRRNAVEAMKMAEQRRRREIEQSQVHDQLIKIYVEGKEQILDLKMEQDGKAAANHERLKKEIANQIYVDESLIIAKENERIKKDADELDKKLSQKEKEKLERARKLKAARIESHLKEVEQEKLMKAKKMQQLQEDINNRCENLKVNMMFAKQNSENKLKVLTDNRNILDQQVNERLKQLQVKDYSDLEFQRKENEIDDRQFFKIAKNLLKDAKEKGRPLLPIQRAIGQYKIDNRLYSPQGIPPHLISNVPIPKTCDRCEPKRVAMIKYDIDELKAMNPVKSSIKRYSYMPGIGDKNTSRCSQ